MTDGDDFTVRPEWSKGPCLICGERLADHDADPIGEGLARYACPDLCPACDRPLREHHQEETWTGQVQVCCPESVDG